MSDREVGYVQQLTLVRLRVAQSQHDSGRQFLADAQVKGSSIEVGADNGVVTLEGPVANSAAHDRALALTRETDGVVQIVDRLSVQNASDRAKARTRK